MLGPDLQRMPYELSTEAYESSFILKITHTKTSKTGKKKGPHGQTWGGIKEKGLEFYFFLLLTAGLKGYLELVNFSHLPSKQS